WLYPRFESLVFGMGVFCAELAGHCVNPPNFQHTKKESQAIGSPPIPQKVFIHAVLTHTWTTKISVRGNNHPGICPTGPDAPLRSSHNFQAAGLRPRCAMRRFVHR